MEIVVSAPHLAGPGGVQTYVLTIAAALESLGHGVTLYAPIQGAIAELARERGLRVAATEADLPADADAVISQDAATALDLAHGLPAAARALVVHGADLDLHLPPALEGAAGTVIAMNGPAERRARATATAPEVLRLRQPVDVRRLRSAGPVRERPRHVLMLGNYLEGPPRDRLVAVIEREGLECSQVGAHGEATLDPLGALARADIVIGQGRSILDAMAAGRAAWVYGPGAGDGWVTPATYPAIEEDGIRGLATGRVLEAQDFARDLAGYDPAMGEANRRLAVLHHSPYDHAVALVDALRGAGLARVQPGSPARELALLVRTRHEAEVRAFNLQRELRLAIEAHDRVERENAAVHRAYADLERKLGHVLASRRWRAATALAAPLHMLRRRRSR